MEKKFINDHLTSLIQDLIIRNANLSYKNGYPIGKLETIKDICKKEKYVFTESIIKIIES